MCIRQQNGTLHQVVLLQLKIKYKNKAKLFFNRLLYKLILKTVSEYIHETFPFFRIFINLLYRIYSLSPKRPPERNSYVLHYLKRHVIDSIPRHFLRHALNSDMGFFIYSLLVLLFRKTIGQRCPCFGLLWLFQDELSEVTHTFSGLHVPGVSLRNNQTHIRSLLFFRS